MTCLVVAHPVKDANNNPIVPVLENIFKNSKFQMAATGENRQ
jgi:hypothetical protein